MSWSEEHDLLWYEEEFRASAVSESYKPGYMLVGSHGRYLGAVILLDGTWVGLTYSDWVQDDPTKALYRSDDAQECMAVTQAMIYLTGGRE